MIRNRSVFGTVLVAAVLLLVIARLAFAQTLNVKLGLWETTTVTQMSGTPPVDTSKMTPQQRERIQAALEASRKRAATPHTSRTCLTKEKLDRMPFQDKDDASCKQTIVARTTSVYDVKFECGSAAATVTSGQWRFEALTPESVKGSGGFTQTGTGQKMAATTMLTAKWIGASCGDVK